MIYLTHQLAPSDWEGKISPTSGLPYRAKDDGLGQMEEFDCSVCGRKHDKLWTVKRVRADTFGHFPVIRLNGEERVIDTTLPTVVDRLPRDAVEVPQERAERIWHGTGHYFGED